MVEILCINQINEYRTGLHDLSTVFSTGVENELKEKFKMKKYFRYLLNDLLIS